MDYDAAHQAVQAKYEERGATSGAGGHLQMGFPRWVHAPSTGSPPLLQLLSGALGSFFGQFSADCL